MTKELIAALAGFIAAKVITPQQAQTIEEYVARGGATLSQAISGFSSYDQDMYYDDRVYVDSAATGGSTFPYGTRRFPCKTLAQARTVAAAHGVNKIHLLGITTVYTLDADMTNYVFTSDSKTGAALDLNGFSVNYSAFLSMAIIGAPHLAAVDSIVAYDCLIALTTNPILLTCWECFFTGVATQYFTSLVAVNARGGTEATYPVFDIANTCYLYDFVGVCEIAGLDDAADVCDIQGTGIVYIAASNTAGVITVRGDIAESGAGGGVTINRYDNYYNLWTLLGRLTAARAGYIDELGAANIPADIDTLIATRCFQLQSPILVAQATPVQNTWYTILNTTLNCNINICGITIATTSETLEVKITIDGQTLTGSIAATAGVYYICLIALGGITFISNATTDAFLRALLIEGRSIKIEMRKTTNNGVGTLSGYCIYGKL